MRTIKLQKVSHNNTKNSKIPEKNDTGSINCDSTQLLGVFPQEIWDMVLERVEDNQTLEKLSSSMPFFRNSLQKLRVQFLFPKVLSALINSEHLILPSNSSELKNNHVCTTCNKSVQVKPYHNILKLRQICKNWCSTIDNHCASNPAQYKMKGDANTKNHLSWATTEFTDFNGTEIQTHLKDTPPNRCPFIGKSLKITMQRYPVSLVREMDHAGPRLTQLIETYGHYFWHCEIYIKEGLLNNYGHVIRMKHWLCCLPNLKTLKIRNVEYPELLTSVRNHSLWKIPEWSRLEYLSCLDVPPVLFDVLVEKCCKVEKLEVIQNRQHGYYFYFLKMFANLKELSYSCVGSKDFKALMESDIPNLTKLNLECNRKVFKDWQELFQNVKVRWGKSLTNLFVKVNQVGKEKKAQIEVNQSMNVFKDCEKLKVSKVVIGKRMSLYIVPEKGAKKAFLISK